MSEILNFDDTDPAADPGYVLVKWKRNTTPDGIDPTTGYPYFNLSGEVPAGAGLSVIGFVINNGATGVNVGPMLVVPITGLLNSCVVVTKRSDASIPLQFNIKQNGTSIFTGTLPTVAPGTSSGTVSTFTSFTTVPFGLAKGDVFSIDIVQGSATWLATIQLES